MMQISGAWWVDALPTEIVIELPDGELKHVRMTPFRQIGDADLQPYKGYHPRKIKGSPLPAYMYGPYGLSKSGESLSEVLRVRLAPSVLERLKAAADAEDKTVSEYVREWVRGL